MLSYYRSQHDNESWIAAIAAIMDTCALLLVGLKSSQGFQARMTFATARLAITELCRIFEISGRPLDRDRLPHAEFQRMQRVLSEADWIFEDENPESELVAFRATFRRCRVAIVGEAWPGVSVFCAGSPGRKAISKPNANAVVFNVRLPHQHGPRCNSGSMKGECRLGRRLQLRKTLAPLEQLRPPKHHEAKRMDCTIRSNVFCNWPNWLCGAMKTI